MLKALERIAQWTLRLVLAVACLFSGPAILFASGALSLEADWRTASHERTGLAPDPRLAREAIVQVYGARAFNWRGAFGIHTWVATKPRNAEQYQVHQVLGWYARHGRRAVLSTEGYPDREWYGAPPVLLAELRGPKAAAAIEKVHAAVRSYPYDYAYALWPGPNSNTFVAHITRQIPELEADLPPSAIGKDYLSNGRGWGPTPSGSGFQASWRGLLGLLVSASEGWEINLLGLGFGIDPGEGSLRLPGVGKLSLR